LIGGVVVEEVREDEDEVVGEPVSVVVVVFPGIGCGVGEGRFVPGNSPVSAGLLVCRCLFLVTQKMPTVRIIRMTMSEAMMIFFRVSIRFEKY
jgi:hypothetical protein